MGAIITLTTDFGLSDAYVAAMKGVILSINPEAKLVDICHSIEPQNIAQAAFVLGTACPFFPERTIHLVVVDPGVGTERRAVILRTLHADFVAPDNGVLSYVIKQAALKPLSDIGNGQVELGQEFLVVSLDRPEFWRSSVSSTFHGRDIFAPVAAQLSLGTLPIHFGEVFTSLTMLPLPHPQRASDGSLTGHVLHIDSFGNLITDITVDDLQQTGQAMTIGVGGQVITGLSRTYEEGRGLMALIGSNGYLEISLEAGNAGAFLGAGVGDEVKISAGNR